MRRIISHHADGRFIHEAQRDFKELKESGDRKAQMRLQDYVAPKKREPDLAWWSEGWMD